MEIILQEEVMSLGQIGDVVKVKNGYARNYLLPRGLAVVANRRNIRVLDHQKRLATEKKERVQKQATVLTSRLSGLTIAIPARAGEGEKLFGSVTNIDIEKALQAQGVSLDRRRILLADPIKQLGTYEVPVRLTGGVQAKVTVQVTPEDAA